MHEIFNRRRCSRLASLQLRIRQPARNVRASQCSTPHLGQIAAGGPLQNSSTTIQSELLHYSARNGASCRTRTAIHTTDLFSLANQALLRLTHVDSFTTFTGSFADTIFFRRDKHYSTGRDVTVWAEGGSELADACFPESYTSPAPILSLFALRKEAEYSAACYAHQTSLKRANTHLSTEA